MKPECDLTLPLTCPPPPNQTSGLNSAGGSRKRSGADGDEPERTRLAGEGAGSRLRLRDPVRRAFTLPSMLCNTFSVAPTNGALGAFEDSSQAGAGCAQQDCWPAGQRDSLGPAAGQNERLAGSDNLTNCEFADNKLGLAANNLNSLSSLITPIRRLNPPQVSASARSVGGLHSPGRQAEVHFESGKCALVVERCVGWPVWGASAIWRQVGHQSNARAR